MSDFFYKAKRPGGEIYSARKRAKDRFELYRIIRESGDDFISLEEFSENKPLANLQSIASSLFNHVRTSEKINFSRNLGLMLDAGLSLSRALSVLERQSKSKPFKTVLNDLMSSVNKGSSFSESLSKHPKAFSPLFIAMVKAGEESGTLAQALKSVSAQMASSYALESRVRGALMYPGVIITAMIIIGIMMFIFVIPTLMKTFEDLSLDLPLSTRMILGLSTLIREHGLILLLVILVIGLGIYMWSRKPVGRKFVHGFLLRIPVIGTLVQEVNAARTARTLSSLLSSGVDIVESVNITSSVVQNVHFRAVLTEAAEVIKKGSLMSKVFAGYERLYPVFFTEMISVGEETGKMGEMLGNVATYYEADVEQKTKDMSTIIEPVLMIVVGAAVGFFALSMIAPMYSLVDAI
jgi:type IV pilus assembly protein PilC